MPSPIRIQILRLCAQFVAGHGLADWPLAVSIEVPNYLARLTASEPEWSDALPIPDDCPPIIRAIMEAAGPVPMPGKQLATKAGYEYNSHFRTQLAELVREGYLRHGPDGYSKPDDAT